MRHHGRSMSSATVGGGVSGSKVDRQWRRLSRLNSLLVQAKSKLSLAHPASLAELQKHAAELEKEGLVLED